MLDCLGSVLLWLRVVCVYTSAPWVAGDPLMVNDSHLATHAKEVMRDVCQLVIILKRCNNELIYSINLLIATNWYLFELFNPCRNKVNMKK